MEKHSDEEELLGKEFESQSSEDLEFRLFIHLKSARNLSTKKPGSVSAFVKFLLGQKVVHKTKTVKDFNPTWDESFMFVLPDLSQNLEIKVVNHSIMKDELIGFHQLDLTSLEQTTAEKVRKQNTLFSSFQL